MLRRIRTRIVMVYHYNVLTVGLKQQGIRTRIVMVYLSKFIAIQW